ncbi:hypothetical protein [Methanobrevibacter sp. DSM 116169]|uniref:hypothetical protein n=1 Tax=Methanobrevibacter sp. DSM 116169 TaxID=3242727 RepID=UPI0038FCAD88
MRGFRVFDKVTGEELTPKDLAIRHGLKYAIMFKEMAVTNNGELVLINSGCLTYISDIKDYRIEWCSE